MQIKEHVSLKELTTLKIGGTARYFVSVSTVEDLAEAVSFAREKGIPFAVLGGGSNVLIAGTEFPGLLIKIDIQGTEWTPPSIPPLKRGEGKRGGEVFIVVIVGAGESWDGLVAEAVRRGLWGIENLSGIPGTAGAAPIQNIGAYGAEVGDVIEWVEVFDTKTAKIKRLANAECAFGYRDSIFKHPEGKPFIVTWVALRLKKSGTPNLEYKDLRERFRIYDLGFKKEKPTLKEIREAVLEIRSKKFPELKEFGTAGSFFKNPIVSWKKFDELKKRFPNLPGFELKVNGQRLMVKLPLAWILDNVCGLKGFKKGNIALFERQPIVLVNLGGASAEETKQFAEEVIACVKTKTGITIEWEVALIS